MKFFEISGDDVDLGYKNLRAGQHRAEREIVVVLEAMWERYSPYADPRFCRGICARS
jgi:hypothetical protein